MRFYTTSQLGPKRHLTPEGFLLCEDVPIARTGVQLYADHELPQLKSTHDKIIRVFRDAEHVFAPHTIASFAGKPITNDHPPERVSPATWRTYSVGVILDPRRGDGRTTDENFLYADFLFQEPSAIQAVLDGKVEVSAGYDADYEQTSPGEAHQYNIVGNHVALVDKGRCGIHCAIGDQEMPVSVRDRILQAARTGDSALRSALDEMFGQTAEQQPDTTKPGDDDDDRAHRVVVNVHGGTGSQANTKDDDPPGAVGANPAAGGDMAAVNERLDRIEQAIVMLADALGDEGDGNGDEGGNGDTPVDDAARRTRDESATAPDSTDPAPRPPKAEPDKPIDEGALTMSDRRRTTDSAGGVRNLQALFAETMSRAEMLVAGVRLPTFDAKATAKATTDTLCTFRRNVLSEALRNDTARGHVEAIVGSTADMKAMTCDAVTLAFNGATELARRANTSSMAIGTRGNSNGRGNPALFGQTPSIADINRKNKEAYGIK